MTRLTLLTILVASFGAACTDDSTPEIPDNTPPEGSTSGTADQTFDHDNTAFDPWAVIDRLAKEGPTRYTSRVHGCPKVRSTCAATACGIEAPPPPMRWIDERSYFPRFGLASKSTIMVVMPVTPVTR